MLSRSRAFLQRHELISHTLTLVTGTAASQVIVVLLTLVLTRVYSPDAFGQFAVYTSIVAIVAVIATLRYDMAIMLPKSDANAAVLKSVVTRSVLIVSVLASLGCGLGAPLLVQLFNAPDLGGWLWLAGLSVFALGEVSGLMYWLNRQKRYRDIGINRIQQSSTSALAQLGFGVAQMTGIGGLLLGQLLGQFGAIATLRWKTRKTQQFRKEAASTPVELMKRYRKMPLLNGPTALIDAVRLNGINILIGAYSVAELGQFSMAWRLLEVPAALISGALSQVFFQRFAATARGNMFDFTRKSVLRTALVAVGPFALIYLLAPPLFPIILGSQWDQAGLYAQALVPWLFMNVITSPISTLFVVVEAQQHLFAFSAVYMVVPLAILSLYQGDLAAAITIVGLAMAGMLCIMLILAFWVARRHDRCGGLHATDADPA